MTTRFPQSGASVNYRIKPAYASKIKAIFWAAGADAAHRLYPGDTATTVITRATSGCTFDTENGVIAGQNYGNEGVYFSDAIAGGYGVSENTAFGLGASYWGDIQSGLNEFAAISTNNTPLDQYQNKSRILFGRYGYAAAVGLSGYEAQFSDGISDNVRGWMGTAFRYDPVDPINNFRHWINGAERTASRTNRTPTSSLLIGDTTTPLRFGGTSTGSSNAAGWFECVYVHTGLTDAELNAITADPSIVIEATGGSGASASFTVTASDAAFSGSGEVRPMASFAVTSAAATFSGSASIGEAEASISATATNATFSGSATGDTSSGSITTPALKNNTGTVLANETGVTVYVYTPDTGALVVKKTGQTTNASGVLTVTDASIVPSTLYRIVLVLGSGAEGMDKVTAT